MKPFKQISALILFFLCLLPVPALADLEEMILNQETTPRTHQRSEVPFPHQIHMDSLDCLNCHHVYRNNKNVLDEDDLYEDNPDIRCSTCHDNGTSMDTTKAFHHQCMGCHLKATNKESYSENPGMCGSCHIDKESQSLLPEKDHD